MRLSFRKKSVEIPDDDHDTDDDDENCSSPQSTSHSQLDTEPSASVNGENTAECVSHADNYSEDVDEEMEVTRESHDNLCDDDTLSDDVDNSSDDADEEMEETSESHDNLPDDDDNLSDNLSDDVDNSNDDVDEEMEETRESHDNLCDNVDAEVEKSHDILCDEVDEETHDNLCDHVKNEGAVTVEDNERQSSSQQRTNSSLNLTAMADQNHDDTSEVDSIGCDGRVSVGEYRVKPQNAEHLRTILSKHGDIGASCPLQSTAARSFFMELMCETFQELNTTNLANITENKIRSLKASLRDAEKEKIEVGWLKTRLDEILEAKQAFSLLKPSSSLRQLRAEQETKIQTLREQLDVYGRDLSIKMNEIHALRQKIDVALQDLSQEEGEGRKIDLRILKCKAKVRRHLAKLETLVADLV